jgi:nitrate reductase NapE component
MKTLVQDRSVVDLLSNLHAMVAAAFYGMMGFLLWMNLSRL